MIHKVHEILRIIKRDGWVLHNTTGSHRQFVHPSKPGRVTVWGKESQEVSLKTWSTMLTQAGLK